LLLPAAPLLRCTLSWGDSSHGALDGMVVIVDKDTLRHQRSWLTVRLLPAEGVAAAV
jgi:hypothetical protein